MSSPNRTKASGRGLTESELGSSAQRERRKRILDATLALASKGGFDAVQMRAVAERADVALGTLYRYFPSKVHLLVAALGNEFERAQHRTPASPPGDTAMDRVLHVLHRQTRALQRDPHLTEAMTRAFMFADASAAAEVDFVGRIIDHMFATAMSDGAPPTEEQLAIARVISDVWMSNLVAWVTHRLSATDLTARLETTVRLLLGHRPDLAG